MKIKRFNEAKVGKWDHMKDYFIKIDDETFESSFPVSEELSDLTRYEKTWIRGKEGYVQENVDPRVQRKLSADYGQAYIVKWQKYIRIWKVEDEWFLVKTGRDKESTTSDFQFRKYFKCDQFDGLKKLIEEWISVRGNLRTK